MLFDQGDSYQSAISTFVSGARPSVSFRAVDAEAVARVLASAPVFNALSETERGELVGHLRPRRFSRDEVVFHRDDAAGHVYVILSGSVKVSIPDEEGHEIVVAVEREGAVFGELALFDDAPRSATVTALDQTQVVTLAREDFLRVLERSPRATREILRLLARTVRRASGRIEDLVFLDVPGRVAKCLLDLATAHARTEVELTQDDLAAFVGATRVSVNRALADLESQGAIAVGRRHIAVKEPALLRKQVRY
ncbi:MAG: Crp/Fnr family transcriptional regulator [Chloroflexi bacterium]|nr:MAG: Crp/Fnr family transcriptional regulator [Chloroflexota bacterium]TME73276.1 MAG: Crp/Fnr family transcriptional regulator [Chloroflexota bacterium]TMG48824.1 MAG: Crp/Fnr family transcriptional regulator [Chloroflexota bacterium]